MSFIQLFHSSTNCLKTLNLKAPPQSGSNLPCPPALPKRNLLITQQKDRHHIKLNKNVPETERDIFELPENKKRQPKDIELMLKCKLKISQYGSNNNDIQNFSTNKYTAIKKVHTKGSRKDKIRQLDMKKEIQTYHSIRDSIKFRPNSEYYSVFSQRPGEQQREKKSKNILSFQERFRSAVNAEKYKLKSVSLVSIPHVNQRRVKLIVKKNSKNKEKSSSNSKKRIQLERNEVKKSDHVKSTQQLSQIQKSREQIVGKEEKDQIKKQIIIKRDSNRVKYTVLNFGIKRKKNQNYDKQTLKKYLDSSFELIDAWQEKNQIEELENRLYQKNSIYNQYDQYQDDINQFVRGSHHEN